jgi:hypothetical protein
MVITNAKYHTDRLGNNSCICATINGIVSSVPLDEANKDYVEILKQVADGDITIAEAD